MDSKKLKEIGQERVNRLIGELDGHKGGFIAALEWLLQEIEKEEKEGSPVVPPQK